MVLRSEGDKDPLKFEQGQTYRVKTTFWAHPVDTPYTNAKYFELGEKIVIYDFTHITGGFGRAPRKIYSVLFYDLTGKRYTVEYKHVCNEVVPL